jgi:hypothetical protein
MAHLPRFEAAEFATTADVAATRDDIASLRSELKGDIASLRSDLKGDIREVAHGLKDANQRLDRLFLALVGGLFVVIATMASLVFTVG